MAIEDDIFDLKRKVETLTELLAPRLTVEEVASNEDFISAWLYAKTGVPVRLRWSEVFVPSEASENQIRAVKKLVAQLNRHDSRYSEIRVVQPRR